jgi:hypothetical protein
MRNILRSDRLASAALLGLPSQMPCPQESERILDAAIECTFPASDPIAVQSAFEAACARQDREFGDVSGE